MPIDREALLGSWELCSFEVDDGSGRRPWRPPATGLLLYGRDGAMAVAINGTAEAGGDPLSAMLFYAGRYVLGFDGGHYVEHHVRQSTDPLRMHMVLRRELLLEGETLKLEGGRPDGMRSWLSWRRVTSYSER